MDKPKIKPKICMISGDYPPVMGGVADYTKCLFDKLTEGLGRENILLITSSLENNKKNTVLEKKEKNIFKLVNAWDIKGIIKLLNLIKKIKPDIVHIQYPTHKYGYNSAINFLPLLLRVFQPKISIISTIHEFSNRGLMGKTRLSINVLFSNKIIVVSRLYQKDILSFLWPFKCFLKRKIEYIPVGPNIFINTIVGKEDSDDIRKKLNINKRHVVFCNFGNIRPGKGIEFLIEVFYELVKEGYNDFKLLFIGRHTEDYYQQIRKTIKEYKLEKHIYITGHCPPIEVSKYFSVSDVCILPFEDGVTTKRGSFFAPFFHKIPIITTKAEFMPEELINYKNVILINYGNKKELKQSILEIANNDILRKKISENITETLYQFSWDAIANKTTKIYYQYL